MEIWELNTNILLLFSSFDSNFINCPNTSIIASFFGLGYYS